MHIEPAYITSSVSRALEEDIGSGDVTANLTPRQNRLSGRIINREPAIVCGQRWVEEIFHQVDPQIELAWQVGEGDFCNHNTTWLRLNGNARGILTAERTALNFLQFMSATATQAYHYQQAVEGTATRILDTRKTIPGLRLEQKYAVATGGASNHRIGLFDAYLIKENHIRACGSIAQAIAAVPSITPDIIVEVEVETIDELEQALAAGARRILLDNFSLEDMHKAVAISQGQAELEVSGNVNLETVRTYAETGVDFISVGAITKNVRAIDLSLLFD